MSRALWIFLFMGAGIFLLDEGIKMLFLQGYVYRGECIDLTLRLNDGVAFSMLRFLGPYLKWVQAALVVVLLLFALKERWVWHHPLISGLLAGGALGNLYDRFAHGAVVDYVAWHCGFRYPVFNLADVAIDVAVVALLWVYWRSKSG